MHLVVNKPVKLVIGSKDVIHDVGLAHFRMKMDAVPGTPTTMWFTPTNNYRRNERRKQAILILYMKFPATRCAAKVITSMRGEIIVETQEEFDTWMASKKPQYLAAISG